jgi:hypothetical protein
MSDPNWTSSKGAWEYTSTTNAINAPYKAYWQNAMNEAVGHSDVTPSRGATSADNPTPTYLFGGNDNTVKCPSCGLPNPTDRTYCAMCKHGLPGGTQDTSAAARAPSPATTSQFQTSSTQTIQPSFTQIVVLAILYLLFAVGKRVFGKRST